MADHFGDPFREQRCLASGRGVVVLEGHGVIRLTGRDRLTWLDSLVSQEVGTLEPGESAETLLLDPNGRIERVVRVLDDATATWLLVDTDASGLADWLDGMVFRRDVTVEDVSSDVVAIGFVEGGTAESSVTALAAAPNGVPLTWRDPWRNLVFGGWQYATPIDHPSATWAYGETLIPARALAELRAAASNGEIDFVGTLALDALRIAAWRPALADVDETSLPHEFDWLRSAVHLSKGCYRGQESVAKVHNLGHPPRRLVFLDLDGSHGDMPGPGATVSLAGAPDEVVGKVTSSARHFEDGPIALALIKRSVPIDADLVVHLAGGELATARTVVIVPPDAGKSIDVPRITRERARPSRS